MTTKDRIDLWLKAIGLLLGAIGFGWGLLQFADVVQQRRVSQTLVYVERYGKDELLAARTELGEAWLVAKASLEQLRAAGVSPPEYEARHRQLVFSVLNARSSTQNSSSQSVNLEEDVGLISSFFDELQICLRSNLCDRSSAEAFFRPEAGSFYCLYRPYLDYMSANYASSYGVGLVAFAETDADDCYK